LIALLKQAIAADPFPLSARAKLLRGIGGAPNWPQAPSQGARVTIRVQFKVESGAVAFAKAFDGQLV